MIEQILAGARARTGREQVEWVNRRVNAMVTYTAEDKDQWQSLEETFRRGAGDCEDFAIAKYTLLRRLGVSPNDMALGYGYAYIGRSAIRQAHLVCLVMNADMGPGMHILDNLVDTVYSHRERDDLDLLFLFNEAQLWTAEGEADPEVLTRMAKWQRVVSTFAQA